MLLLRLSILPAVVLLAGCTSTPPSTKLKVAATTSIIGDAARSIGRDHVEVEMLMGPGIDPHKFQPSAGDIGKLASAKLVLFNGLHLEGKMVDLLEKPNPKRKAVAVSRGIPESDLRAAEVDGGSHDPHIWFDVSLWKKCAEVVRDELCELDPAHAEDFRVNADSYRKDLDQVEASIRQSIATLPKERRVLVTSHDAFGYFGRAYGFEVHGLQGVSTAAESDLPQVQKLIDFLGGRRIPAVFTETSVPTTGLKKVIEGVKMKYGFDVEIVGGDDALYSDALGEAGSPGQTYTGMVKHNVEVIVKHLAKP